MRAYLTYEHGGVRMNDINFIITNILIGCAALAIFLLRLRISRPSASQWNLKYPWQVQLIAITGLMLVFTGTSMAVELTAGLARLLVVLLILPLGAVVFLGSAEVFASLTSYSETTLYRCSPWKKMVELPFADVVRIEGSLFKPYFIIHSCFGQCVRISKYIEGADELLGYAEEGLESRPAAVDGNAEVVGEMSVGSAA